MKRGFIVLMLAVIFSTPAAFGQAPSAEDMAARIKAQIDEVITTLALTGEKETKVRGILENESAERASIFQGFQGQDRNARSAMREEMAALGERTTEQLKVVLSAEEMEKYTKIQAEIQERRRAQFGGGRGGQPPVN